MMFHFLIYSIVIILTGFIGIYALSSSDSLINITTANFVFETNVPFFLLSSFLLVILSGVIFFFVFWGLTLPRRIKEARKNYLYKKEANDVFDLLCNFEVGIYNTKQMKKFSANKNFTTLDHYASHFIDYKIASHKGDQDALAVTLMRIKNHKIFGSLYYKEMISKKIKAEEYKDAEELLKDFAQKYSLFPLWYYKTGIFVFSHLGDIDQGKNLITKAKKENLITNTDPELSMLYLNKAKLLEEAQEDPKKIEEYLNLSLKTDPSNTQAAESLYNFSLNNKLDKNFISLLEKSWEQNANYKVILMLFKLLSLDENKEQLQKLEELKQRNSTDQAYLALSKTASIIDAYDEAYDFLNAIKETTNNHEYDRVAGFLQIMRSSNANKEKLVVLKKTLLD